MASQRNTRIHILFQHRRLNAMASAKGHHHVLTSDQLVPRASAVSAFEPSGHLFPAVMEAARRWWRSKAAAELAAIIGCDVRSAARYLAGHRTPDAEAILALLRSDYGARLVTVAVAAMPWDRQLKFWKEMGKAARRMELIAQRAEIDKELSKPE